MGHTRTETFTLADGTGRLDVRGGRYASALFVDGRPFVFNFWSCDGSIGQEVCYFAPEPDGGFLDLREVTATLPAEDVSLARLIAPLLRQFTPGDYTLTLASAADVAPFVERHLPDYARKFTHTESGYYPITNNIYGAGTLVMTQPDETMDDARVAHFWYAIEAGARPFAITAAVDEGMCEFVLDGHHKLMAYAYAKVKPWRLCISRKAMPLTEGDWPAHVGIPWLAFRKCVDPSRH